MWSHDLKIQRATHHFNELETRARRWEEGKGYALGIDEDGHAPHYIARAELLRPVEDELFPVLIGDVLQNARAALDYLATALGDAGAGGFMDDGEAAATMFPIVGGDDPINAPSDGDTTFAQRAARRLPTVSEPVRAAIADLQPYKTGGDLWAYEPLWALNELARFDRHRFLHLGVVKAGGFRLNETASRNVRISDLRVETGRFDILEGTAAEEAAIFGGKDSAVLATFTAERIDPGQEMHMDFEGALEVAFDDYSLPPLVRIPDESVRWCLRWILADVREVITTLRPFLPAEPPRF